MIKKGLYINCFCMFSMAEVDVMANSLVEVFKRGIGCE